ncbi:MAG: SulP family inorganic anion transporter [Myxococcota bacterium]
MSVRVASALREALADGYDRASFRADLLAGAVVGVVALPLSMALAIAVGVPPQHGLYTAIVAGAVAALLGGSRTQVTGPTAAFVVILAPIVSEHGLPGLLTAGFMAGGILVLAGLFGMGSLIRLVPYPVTTGFTTGIAVVIATLQVRDVLGLQTGALPDAFHEKVGALWNARHTASLLELSVAALTFALLLGLPRVVKRVPAPLLAIGGASTVAFGLQAFDPGLEVATIGSRFHTVIDGVAVAGIPSVLPRPALPWDGGPGLADLRALLPAALTIAALGAIESLLSAVVADGMTGHRHDPDAELVGQGVANLVAPFFGGIAATGALARTATNVRSGARSPLASVTHAVVVLGVMVAAAPLVAYIPMASLAALLVLVAWNMAEVPHFLQIVRIGPKSDIAVLLTCFGLTVAFDMIWAVGVGFVLASLLFMRRMAELSESRFLDAGDGPGFPELGPGTVLYRVEGPLFFGAARKAMDALHASRSDAFTTLVLDLGRVPVIDTTGFVALHGSIASLRSQGKTVVLLGPLPPPSGLWDRARAEGLLDEVHVAGSFDDPIVETLVRAATATARP